MPSASHSGLCADLEFCVCHVLQAAATAKSAGKKPQRRRKSGEGGAEAGSDAELQLAGLLQVVHLLANPPRGPGAGGAGANEEEEEEEAEEEREVVPLEREVVALVVDALFDRWVRQRRCTGGWRWPLCC